MTDAMRPSHHKLLEKLQHISTTERSEANLVLKGCHIEYITTSYVSSRQCSTDTTIIINSEVGLLMIAFSCPHKNIRQQIRQQSLGNSPIQELRSTSHQRIHQTVHMLSVRQQIGSRINIWLLVITTIYEHSCTTDLSQRIMRLASR